MAVTLEITLSDEEQAKVNEWLDELLPVPKTPAERKVLLERVSRRLLRDHLIYRMSQHRQKVAYDAMVAAEDANVAADEAALPVDPDDPFTPEVEV